MSLASKLNSAPVLLLLCLIFCCISVTMAKSHRPEQIRMQLTGRTPGEAVISYVTGSSANPDAAHPPNLDRVPMTVCRYGLKGTDALNVTKGTFKRFTDFLYTADIHECVLSDLIPGAEYIYQVGDDAKEDGLSEWFTFTAGPPTRWAFFGDYGTQHIDKSLSQLLKDRVNGVFDGAVHLGDIAYNLHDDLGKRGDDFMNFMQPVMATVPYHLTPGNHEKHDNFTHYNARYRSLKHLGESSGSRTHLHYSQDLPLLHLVSFDSELFEKHVDPNAIERQYRWLEADLQRANLPENRDQRPWIITFAHKCDWHEKTEFDRFRELFHKYGVDLHFCGHEHNYQRLYPGVKEEVEKHDKHAYINPKHWMQMVVGSPGCQDHITAAVAPYKNAHAATFFSYGYGVLEVVNKTHVYWEWRQTHEAIEARGVSAFDRLVVGMQQLEWDVERERYLTHKYGNPDNAAHADADAGATGVRQRKGLGEPLRGDDVVKDYMWLIQAHHGMRT